MAAKSKVSKLLTAGKVAGADAPLDHAALAVDEFELDEPEQIAGMVEAVARGLARDLLVFAQDRRQLELPQMMGEQTRRAACRRAGRERIGLAVMPPSQRAARHNRPARSSSRVGGADRDRRKDRDGPACLSIRATSELLDRVEADGAEPDRLASPRRATTPRRKTSVSRRTWMNSRLPRLPMRASRSRRRCGEAPAAGPALQGRGLIQRAGLRSRSAPDNAADRKQSRPARRSRVAGDLGAVADNDHLVDEALHQHRRESRSASEPNNRSCDSGRATSTTTRSARLSQASNGAAGRSRGTPPCRRRAARRSSAHGGPARSFWRARQRSTSLAFSASKRRRMRHGRQEIGARYFTSPSTLPLSLPLPGRPKRSLNR